MRSLVFDFETEIDQIRRLLLDMNVDIVVTNINRILPPEFVGSFRGKLINLHYSLLPLYSGSLGRRTLELSFQDPSRIAGSTIHFVDDSIDGGAQICQVVLVKSDFADLKAFSGALTLLAATSLTTVISSWSELGFKGVHSPAESQTSRLAFRHFSNLPLNPISPGSMRHFLRNYPGDSIWGDLISQRENPQG